MSKFKVGDRVVFKDEGWRGRVVGIRSDGAYVVQFDGVGDYAQGADYFREDQLARNAVFSTNPVVKNALNRMACNGNSAVATNKSWDWKVGDEVRFEGHPHGTPFKVTAVRGGEVQLDDGNWYRKTMFIAKNSAVANAFYKTEAEAEYRSGVFVDAAANRIKGHIDDEIKTVEDCIKLFKGAPMSDKTKANLERLNSHLQKLKRCKTMFIAKNSAVACNARTDWGMEVYKLQKTVEKLIAKAKAEGATGPGSYGELFEECLKVLRGY